MLPEMVNKEVLMKVTLYSYVYFTGCHRSVGFRKRSTAPPAPPALMVPAVSAKKKPRICRNHDDSCHIAALNGKSTVYAGVACPPSSLLPIMKTSK